MEKTKLKVAIIVPKLEKKGPVIVATEIAQNLKHCEVDLIFLNQAKNKFKINLFGINSICKLNVKNLKKYDVIHSCGIKPDMVTFFYKFFSRKKIFITTMHNFIFEDLAFNYPKILAYIYGYLWIIFISNKNKIIVLTTAQKKYYSSFFDEKRMTVIGNGRDLTNSVEDESLKKKILLFKSKLSYDTILLGSTSVFLKRKGLEQAIFALALLPKKYSLILVGDGPEMGYLIQLAKDKELIDRCLFTGYHENNSCFFEYIDIFLLTSYSEAYPLALIEASLHGVPSVVTKLETLNQILPSNLIQFYNIDNISELVKGIYLLVDSSSSLSVSIKNYSIKNLTSKIMAENHYKLYKKLAV